MSHLILHIGTHKTGSTTIQDCFWKNAPLLGSNGIVYPRLKYRHSGHHGLIAHEVGLSRDYALRDGGADIMRGLAQQYQDTDHTLFLSSEEFSRADIKRSVNFQQIKQTFAVFDRVTVLCFLRPQWRLLQAIYLEISRYRNPPRPPDFVAEALSSGKCQGLFLDYAALLDRLEAVFPSQDIHLVDFEAIRQTEGGILDAALSATGSRIDHRHLSLANGGHSNRSPAPLPQWAANLLAEPGHGTAEMRRRVSKAFVGPTCLFTRQEVDALKDGFARSNAKLRERRVLYQPDFQLTDPDLPSSCIFREDVSIEDWLKIARLFANPQHAAA